MAKLTKRLRLSKETLRILDDQDLIEVVGREAGQSNGCVSQGGCNCSNGCYSGICNTQGHSCIGGCACKPA